MVWEEVRLIQERENRRLASEAALFQMALSSVPNDALKEGINKKAVEQFERTIRLMLGE